MAERAKYVLTMRSRKRGRALRNGANVRGWAMEVGASERVDGFCPGGVRGLRLRRPDRSSRGPRRREGVKERSEGLRSGGLIHVGGESRRVGDEERKVEQATGRIYTMTGLSKGRVTNDVFSRARCLIRMCGRQIERFLSIPTLGCQARRGIQRWLKSLPRWSHQRD